MKLFTLILLFAVTQMVCAQENTTTQSTLLDSLLHQLKMTTDDEQIIHLKTQIAREFIFVNKMQANKLIAEAIDLADATNNQLAKAHAMRVLGAILRESGSNLRGAEIFLETKSIFEKHNDSLGIANCDLSLAHVYEYLAEYELALSSSMNAWKIFKQIGNFERQSVILNNLGIAFINLDKMDSAKKYLYKSIAVGTQIGNLSLLQSAYGNLGRVYYHLNQYDSAKKVFSEVLKLEEVLDEQSNTWATAKSYLLLSRMAYYEEDYDSMQIAFDRVKEICRNDGYLDVLKEAMEFSFEYFEKFDDQDGLFYAWNRYQAISDSLLHFERESKRMIVDWYKDRIQRDNEIALANAKVDKQRNQIFGLGSVIILAVIIVVLLYYFYRRTQNTNKLLVEQKKELERLNDTKAKLFSIISHDFQSPLANVSSFSSVILNHLDHVDIDELKKIAVQMDDSVKSTLMLTKNLLSWAKTQLDGVKSNPVLFDVSELCENLIDSLEPQLNGKQLIISNHLEGEVRCFADPEEIEVVLRNLLTNAMKFSHVNSSIQIKGGIDHESAIIHVVDHGIGMGPDQLDEIFAIRKNSNFGTAGEKGSGIGLILCKDMIDRNNGTLKVTSVENEGSTFTIRLPVKSGVQIRK